MNEELLLLWGQLVRSRRGPVLTQEALATSCGVDQAVISRIERGRVAPSDDVKFRIAAALGTQVADLFPYPDLAAEPNAAAS